MQILKIKSEQSVLIDEPMIRFQRSWFSLYKFPFCELEVYVDSFSFFGLGEYEVLNAKLDVSNLFLYEKDMVTFSGANVQVLRFTFEEQYKISQEKVVPESSVLSISMKQVELLQYSLNSYLSLELRKKGLIVLSRFDNNSQSSKTTTLNTLLTMEADKLGLDDWVVSDTSNREDFKKNYYTILQGGAVAKTELGLGSSIYLPFATEQEIKSLDFYVVPKLKVTGRTVGLHVGDAIQSDTHGMLVCMRKESVYFGGKVREKAIFGEKVTQKLKANI